MKNILRRCAIRFQRLADRRAAIAVTIALATPMLVAITGLSVDIGYWFQQQESLQSAVDAAALAAATADAKYGETTAAAVTPFALAAANAASGNQFGLTAATLTITAGAPAPQSDGDSVTGFTATAQVRRASYFSRIQGLGLPGLQAGQQSATAVADVVVIPQPYCVIATNNAAGSSIYAAGTAQIKSSTCSFVANATACGGGDSDAIAADPAGQISASAITTAGCTYADTDGGAYVGVSSGSAANGASTGYQVANNAAAAPDPLSGMGSPPAWPVMPSPGTGYTSIASDIGYIGPGSRNGVTCGNYNAVCTVASGNYSGLTAVNAANLQFNDPATGNTNIIGGFAGSENIALVLNAPNYFIAGATNAAGAVTGWAMQINTPSFTIAGGSDDFDGGMLLNGSSPVTNFGSGVYMFSAYNSAHPALDDSNANITFTGGTYWFNGGLTIEGNGTASFGPGIYYIENGNLTFMSGSHVTANGATFVLENGAGYALDGGTIALNLTAPSFPNCVAPASYPETAYTDGTDGVGICGIIIYQARNDATADAINEGANTTMTGIIYAPAGALSVTGGATIESANAANTFALIVNTLAATGGSKILPSLGPNAGLGSGSTTSTMLVN